jgi:uncharacterized protein
MQTATGEFVLATTILHLCARIERRPRLWLAALLLASAASLPALTQARLDVSFRPLFADGESLAGPTRDFAAHFGQPGGAWIGAIIDARATAGRVAPAAEALAALPAVAEVLSPPAAGTVSRDGRHALLLARVDIPLEDLPARTRVVRQVEQAVSRTLGDAAAAHYVGVSVVEATYARLVLRSMGLAFALNTLAVIGVLWLLFRTAGGVLVPLAGVAIGTPAALAIMAACGQRLTIVNSMVPTVMLIIGVADGLHMLRAFADAYRGGARARAVRQMMSRMVLPCLLTTLTTAGGFLALQAAGVAAVRDFGANVALGVVVVWLCSMVAVPALLYVLPESLLPARNNAASRGASRLALATAALVTARPRTIVGVAIAAVVVMAASLPWLDVDQRFNAEVPESEPVRYAQALLEREFGGFLGPELFITRREGFFAAGREQDATGRHDVHSALAQAAASVAGVPDVHRVEGPHFSEGAGAEAAALFVRTGDVGTRRALVLAEDVRRRAAAALGPEWNVQVVGEWWLAQQGMAGMLRGMLAGFVLSALFVLPIVGLGLRSGRLMLVAILPNLLPLLFALAFMAWTGISVRIGTSMILAIALAIGIDDSIHVLARIRAEAVLRPPAAAVRAALRTAGTGMLFTTLVLVLGFAAMAASPLLAIRDMGIVAAATLLAALLADALVAPALFLLTTPPAGPPGSTHVRSRMAVPTSSARSDRAIAAATLRAAHGRQA